MTETMNNTALPPKDGKEYVFNGTTWELTEEERCKEKWYKVAQAAKEAGVKESVLRSAVQHGYILTTNVPSATRHGYTKYIRESDLLDWVTDPKKIRDPKLHDDYLAYMRSLREKKSSKKHSEKPRKRHYAPKPTVVEETKEPAANDNNDILAISECIMKLIKEKTKEAYKLGFEDGKLSVQHDDDDAYRRGVEDGKKQAKADLLTLIKEVG